MRYEKRLTLNVLQKDFYKWHLKSDEYQIVGALLLPEPLQDAYD
jgi:hypothetical protein